MDIKIGIVTKDRADVIKDTLERLSELKLDENVILVDGSEGNETKNISRKFSANYIRQKEGRRTRARNIALEECESDYIIYIDDDVIVSENWMDQMKRTLSKERVVGATGKLEGEAPSLSGISGNIREFLFGGKDDFGEILNNGVINGDFFYDDEKEVDHLVGCNMAFKTSVLREVGGFNEEYDVGNAYREETEPSYKAGQKGKLIYNPEASVNHLNEEEEEKQKRWMFYNPYLTKYFLRQNEIVKGVKGRISYLFNKFARHTFYLLRSLSRGDASYKYYLMGEIRGFKDFVLFDKNPFEYEIS